MTHLHIAGQLFQLQTFTLTDATAEKVRAEAAALFELFVQREAEFGFHPSVVVDYPHLSDASASGFLADAAAYVARRAEQATGTGSEPLQTVVLTTHADRVGPGLEAAGYANIPIHMPAGPEHTAAFVLNPCSEGRTLYVEAVNEDDEKIRPSFVLKLTDERDELCGGASGCIHEHQGKRYAYLATLALAAGMPPGSGTAMVETLVQFLRRQDVQKLHLGTQTAGRFYEKAGFKVDHRLVRNLRVRQKGGQAVVGDLVMLSLEL